jgi:cell division cycle 2-like
MQDARFLLASLANPIHIFCFSVKLANLLITDDGILKVADLGSIRDAGRKTLKLTTKVVTLWYRAPELLLGARLYTSAIDIWSIGCLFVELVTYAPLFPGQSDRDMLGRILKLKGAPPDGVWSECFEKLPLAYHIEPHRASFARERSLHSRVPTLSPAGLDLLEQMLAWKPADRITARAALEHPFFSEDPQLEVPRLSNSGSGAAEPLSDMDKERFASSSSERDASSIDHIYSNSDSDSD